MAMTVLLSAIFNVYAQTPLQARLAQKNNLGKDTIQLGGYDGTWYVIKKQDLNGIEYAFLISYKHINSQNTVEFCPLGAYNLDYATSTLRNEMNTEYKYIPNALKDIAVVASLGNDVNINTSVSSPTSEKAGNSPSNSKYVLFAPSYQEVSDWNISLGCSATSFCKEIRNYYWSSHVPNGRWWTRSTDAGTINHKFEVNPGGGTFVGIPVQGSSVCMVGAIWVESGIPYAGDYIITYKANNGTTEPDYLQSENSTNVNVTIITASQVQAGFTTPPNSAFTGWNTKADGTGTSVAAGANMLINSDTTLYAQWKPTYTLYGTVFPFVHEMDETFNSLFQITAKLYAVPQLEGENPIKHLLKTEPLIETNVTYYDGTIFVPTTPLHPGEIGSINNPGHPINWAALGFPQTRSESPTVTPENNLPDPPVGIYSFENVDEGNYILTLSAPGFVTRYAKIEVNSNNSLGHRELIPGDFNNDGIIDQRDATICNALWSSYPDNKYRIKYDVDEDKDVDRDDVIIVTDIYFGFYILLYEETKNWVMEY